MAPPDEHAARYQMGPRSTRGLIAGWRTGQIACVATALVLAVGVLRSTGGLEGAFLGLLLVSGAVAVATWPIAGRSIEQWVPTVMTFAARAVVDGRYRRWHSAGSAPSAGSSSRGLLTRLSIFQLGDTGIGVIGDSEAGTWSSVVPVGGAGFALLDDADRANRIAAWSGVLAAMAREGSGLHRIQWVVRSYPAYLEASSADREGRDTACLSGPGKSRESYSDFVDEIAPGLWSHEVFIAVTVRAGPRSFSKSVAGRRRSPTKATADQESSSAPAPKRPLAMPPECVLPRAPKRPPASGQRRSTPAAESPSLPAPARPPAYGEEPRPAAGAERPPASGTKRRQGPGTKRQRKAEAKRMEAERREAVRREWRERLGSVDSVDSVDRSAMGEHFRQPPEPAEVVPPAMYASSAGRPAPTAPDAGRHEMVRAGGPEETSAVPDGRSRRRAADPASLLRRQLASLVGRLEGAGLRCGPPLSVPQLAANLRRSYETSPVSDGASCPWPAGVTESWTRLRTGTTWQAVYWIAEWPRSEVGTTFMLPLLLSARIRRTVSVTMAPLASLAAVRRAERERTSGSADAELRQRHGFTLSARARREQEARLRRESELAEGHAGYRFSGYVTVTGRDADDLEQACARIEQDAALAQLELRRLYGAQEEAFCCSLPIGRGCR